MCVCFMLYPLDVCVALIIKPKNQMVPNGSAAVVTLNGASEMRCQASNKLQRSRNNVFRHIATCDPVCKQAVSLLSGVLSVMPAMFHYWLTQGLQDSRDIILHQGDTVAYHPVRLMSSSLWSYIYLNVFLEPDYPWLFNQHAIGI